MQYYGFGQSIANEMPPMKTRFSDKYKTIHSFSDHFLVVCPKCAQCAEVTVISTQYPSYARLTCVRCGYSSNEVPLRGYWPDKPKDWYFHRPVWLQAPCACHILWALNLDHLNYMGEYVQAELREKQPDESGMHNQSLLNRLPRWMKESSNRNVVIATIEKLRKTV